MSRDESLATLIRDTLRATLERQSEDPGAVDRVGVAVGAALGTGPQEPVADDGILVPATHGALEARDGDPEEPREA